MLNMSESKVIVKNELDTPNGLGVDWIADNIYWTDNEYKARGLIPYVVTQLNTEMEHIFNIR